MIEWFDAHDGFSSFAVSVVLAVITVYYAWQTKKQVNYAHKTLEEEGRNLRNAALNYSYLINAEMGIHKGIFITYLYYKTNKDDFNNKYHNCLNDLDYKTWNMIKTEIAQYYPSYLMQELVGYYFGLELLVTNEELSDNEKMELVKRQLVSMYKCFRFIESEFNIKLRKQESFSFNDHNIKVNQETGELIIDK